MRLLLLLLLLNSTLSFSQNYIDDYGFEQIAKTQSIIFEHQSIVIKKYGETDSKWFVLNYEEKNVRVADNYAPHYSSNPYYKTENNNGIVNIIIAMPSYEGMAYMSLKDNFSLHTKLTKKIRKGNKYSIEYYLNKPFMANSANKYFYINLLLTQKLPTVKEDNKIQLIQNRILHSDIKINSFPSYSFKKNVLDTIRIEPRPDLWQKFSIEFVAQDDFEFLGLVRDIKHPQGITEFMHLDNVQLYLIEDNTNEKQELTTKIDNLAKQIQFETGSSNLTVQSKTLLDSLSFYLKNIQINSDFFIEINGHTDNEGNEKANLLLSQERAETVKSFFQSKNDNEILFLPILAAGYGTKFPLVANDTEEGKAINRRVEIKIINKKTAKNIVFESLSFEEAKQKAKKENKLIFIDAYTSWCKPCKLMDRDVFTDSTVAKVFNENYINLKIDMESEMGKPLNEKYEVEVYPTLLFVDFEGNLRYKKEGFLNAVELTNLGQEVVQLKQEKNTIQNEDLQKRLYEKAKIEYQANPCKLDFVEAYFNLIDKSQKEEVQKVQSNYVQCLENSQDFSSKQVSFLLNNLVQNSSDTTYNFYLKNKPKFEKNYGDSLLVLESYLEEAFFIKETDSLIKQIGEREKLTQQEIEEFEKIANRYAIFSEKIEKESKEKRFERPVRSGVVDYVIYFTTIQFYLQHKEVDKFSDYLIKYNQLEKLESYRDDFFGDMSIPLRNFGVYTIYYLEQQGKKTEVLRELSLMWKVLNSKNYLSSYDSYLIAAKVFFHNKEKQEAQKMLQKAFELKDDTFGEEKYKELETQINQL